MGLSSICIKKKERERKKLRTSLTAGSVVLYLPSLAVPVSWPTHAEKWRNSVVPPVFLFLSFLLMFKLDKHVTIIASLELPLGSVKTTGLGCRRKTIREREAGGKLEWACLSTLKPLLSLHHSISVSVGWRRQHSTWLQWELREVFRILCHNRPDPSILFIKIFCAVLLQVVWVLKGAPRRQAVVPVVRVVECLLGLLWHRQYVVLQVLGIPQGVGKGVEVQWLIHILILCLGRTVGSTVIFRIIQSLKVSIFSSRNKRVLFHRVQVLWGSTEISVS